MFRLLLEDEIVKMKSAGSRRIIIVVVIRYQENFLIVISIVSSGASSDASILIKMMIIDRCWWYSNQNFRKNSYNQLSWDLQRESGQEASSRRVGKKLSPEGHKNPTTNSCSTLSSFDQDLGYIYRVVAWQWSFCQNSAAWSKWA